MEKRAANIIWIAFFLFILGAALAVLGNKDIAENLMRVSLAGWLVGLLILILGKKDLL